jgi:hypothetical protein
MRDELQQFVGTGQKIQLERFSPSNPLLNGYLLDLSDELGLMHCFDDFEPDGYTVFRVAEVSKVRSGKYEQQWHRMLSGEGLLGGLDMAAPIDLTSMRTAVESIHQHFRRLIVECEERDEELEDFYIGTLVSIDDGELRFDHFDGLGQWSEVPATIQVDEITLVQFETPYIHQFWKYLSGPAPSQAKP